MFQYINELVLFERMGKIPRTFIFDIQMSKCEKASNSTVYY